MYHNLLNEQITNFFPRKGNELIEFEEFLNSINKSYFDLFQEITNKTQLNQGDNTHSPELKDLLIKIAFTYINIETEQINVQVNTSLEEIGKLVNADRAYVFEYDFINDECSNTYEWCAEGISKEIDNLQKFPLSNEKHLIRPSRSGQRVLLSL